jgi:hypothetical protein
VSHTCLSPNGALKYQRQVSSVTRGTYIRSTVGPVSTVGEYWYIYIYIYISSIGRNVKQKQGVQLTLKHHQLY